MGYETGASLSITNQYQPRIYRGWIIVLALFLCAFSVFGVSIFSFIIFAIPIKEEFGWSPSQMGQLVSAMWFGAPLALFAGALIQRVGAWRVLLFGVGVTMACMFSLIFVSEFSQLYFVRILMGFGKISMAVSMPIVLTTWFSNRFGTAIAIVWAGGSAGGVVMSPLTEVLISELGWRVSAMIITAGMLVIWTIVFRLSRGPSKPSDIGLEVDGVQPGTAHLDRNAPAESADPETSDVRSIVRSINWVTAFCMIIAVVGSGMAIISVYSQEPAIMASAGITTSHAAVLLGVIAGAGVVGSLIVGWLLDKAPAYFSSLLIACSVYLGLYLLELLQHEPSIVIAAVAAAAVGMGLASGEVLWMNLTKRQFGVAAFATTYGGWYMALQIGYAAGGGISGWVYENTTTSGVLIFIGLVYLPTAIFSLWRPGIRQ